VLGFLAKVLDQSFEMENAIHDLQLLYETKERMATKQGLGSYECPCNCCHGAKQQQKVTIKKHL
jgi:hypothetical protein